MTDVTSMLAGCARCCTRRPRHELDERGGELVCADTAACEAALPPLVDVEAR